MTIPAAQPSSSYGRERSLRQRAASFVLAVAINLAILWVLIHMAPEFRKKGSIDAGRLSTFNLKSEKSDSSAAKRSAHAPKPVTAPARAVVRQAPPPPVPALPKTYTPFVELSQNEYRQTDISKIEGHPTERPSSAAASSESSGDTPIAEGKGPNGETLYESGFLRPPTNAEMLPYVPKGVPDHGTWADIACQITLRNYLDDCIVLKDYPPGSHFGRGMTQAAFQFKVRQPRVNGKPVVGAWVRLHITFDRYQADEMPAGDPN